MNTTDQTNQDTITDAILKLQSQLTAASTFPWEVVAGSTVQGPGGQDVADTFQPEDADLIETLAASAWEVLGVLKLAKEYGDLPAGHGSRFVRQAVVLAERILWGATA